MKDNYQTCLILSVGPNDFSNVIFQLDITFWGLHMEYFMHQTYRHCPQTLISILVGRFFCKLSLIVAFIQCNVIATLYVIIFHCLYVFNTEKNSFLYAMIVGLCDTYIVHFCPITRNNRADFVIVFMADCVTIFCIFLS